MRISNPLPCYSEPILKAAPILVSKDEEPVTPVTESHTPNNKDLSSEMESSHTSLSDLEQKIKSRLGDSKPLNLKNRRDIMLKSVLRSIKRLLEHIFQHNTSNPSFVSERSRAERVQTVLEVLGLDQISDKRTQLQGFVEHCVCNHKEIEPSMRMKS